MYSAELLIDDFFDEFDIILRNNLSEDFYFKKQNNSHYIFLSTSNDFAKLKISEILTEFIFINYEQTIIKDLLSNDYAYLNLPDKTTILDKTMNLITSNENEFLQILVILKRRFLIRQSILDFLSENSFINLNGFITFRLKEYKKMLSELIDKVINDIRIQREYNDFIAMLKFFVDTQKNRCNKLHIVFEKDGEYTIFNDFNKNITEECFKDFIETKEQNNLNNEDLLISSLITLAPKKVFLYINTPNFNKKIVKTIEQIFCNKVVITESAPLLKIVK